MFLLTPDGNAFNTARIGGVKAFPGGFVILGTGIDEVLEYIPCPEEVAIAWRNAINEVLANIRPNRRFPALDWLSIAREVNPAWAAEQEDTSEASTVPSALSVETPKRVKRAEVGSEQ